MVKNSNQARSGWRVSDPQCAEHPWKDSRVGLESSEGPATHVIWQQLVLAHCWGLTGTVHENVLTKPHYVSCVSSQHGGWVLRPSVPREWEEEMKVVSFLWPRLQSNVFCDLLPNASAWGHHKGGNTELTSLWEKCQSRCKKSKRVSLIEKCRHLGKIQSATLCF